ncbi:hypothetical protein FOCG_15580 [Fusarium oxysporum f. sp. radicis-lycopersici 26381]|nr:hypothetical protein FOCG_15580 [Fusarium oxysporum f. sp. radicis-lycopersici 26381]
MAELVIFERTPSQQVHQQVNNNEISYHEHDSVVEGHAAESSERPDAEFPTGIRLWLTILSVVSILVLASTDMNIVATAVPAITDHFHTVSHVGWYSSAFRLCVCAFQFVFGKAYKLFSIKRIFLLSNIISIAGSVLSGAAVSSTMLVVGRAVAGLGSAGLFAALTGLFLALSWAGTMYPWSSGQVIGPLLTFAVLLGVFVLNQVRRGETAALPPRIMKHRCVIAGFIFIFCVNSTGVVLEYYLPTYYQLVRGYTPVKSGYMMLPIIIAATIGSLIHGAGTSAFGYYTPFMLFASFIMPVAAGLITTFNIDTSFEKLIAYTALSGLSYGIGFIGPQTAVQTVLPADDVPLGLSIILFAQSFGPAVSVPIAQVLFTNRLSGNLNGVIPGLNGTNISNSGLSEMVSNVSESAIRDVLVAIDKSLGQTWYLVAGLASVAIVGSLMTEWRSVKEKRE